MSAYKIQAPGNYPEENIQHTERGESLKSKDDFLSFLLKTPLQKKVKRTPIS
jgi:hypothetical protein